MSDELVKVAEDSARGSFFLVSGTALATVILAISSILIGRLLGPELYGQYSLALVIPSLLFLFTDLGINQGITKMACDLNTKGEIERLTRIVRYSLILKAGVGLLLFAVNYVFADWFAMLLQRPDLSFYIRIASTAVLAHVIIATTTSTFVGLDKTEYNAITTNVNALAKTIISIGLVLIGFSVAGAVIGYVMGTVASAIMGISLLIPTLWRHRTAQKTHEVKDDIKTLIRYGTPLYIAILLTGFIPLYQQFILALFTSDADVGNFKAATNFIALMTVLTIPITTALLPAFSKLDQSTTEKIKKFFRAANKYTAMIVLPFAVLMIIFSSEIVQIVYGSKWESAPLFLSTYCLIYLLVGLGYLTLSSFFNGLGQTRITLVASLISFLAVLILSPILAGSYGVQGLIVAYIIASTIGTAYCLYTARRRFNIKFDAGSIAKIYVAAAVSAAPSILLLLFAPLSKFMVLAVGGILYLFLYATLIPLLKVMPLSELETAMHVAKKTKLLALIAKPVLEYQRRVMQITKETFTIIAKIALITAATLLFFLQDLTLILTDALQSETTSYVLVIPPLLLYLMYRKRKMLKTTLSSGSESPKKVPLAEIAGALLFLTSFLLYWYGSYTFTPLEYHMTALPIFVSACILMLFNMQTLRHMAFPVAFLFLMVPPPAEFLYQAGSLLSDLSSLLAYYVLWILRFPVTLGVEDGLPAIMLTQQDGQILPLQIDVACSGIYSQIGFFVFALFIAYIIRDKTWKKALIFFAGLPLMYLLNVLRIAGMGIMAYYYGMNLALDLFHLFGGWILIFLGTFLLLAVSEKLFKIKISTKPTEKCPECNVAKEKQTDLCFSCGRILKTGSARTFRKDAAKASVLILVLALALYIQAPVFALIEGPSEIIVQTSRGLAVTTDVLPTEGPVTNEYNLTFWFRDEDFELRAKQDVSLVFLYFPKNHTKEVVTVAIEIASTKSSLHRWETCLITYPVSHGRQSQVVQIDLRDTQLLENPPIIGRYFAFNYTSTNWTRAVLYWFETSLFKVNSTSQQKQVKISLIADPLTVDDLPDVKNQLLALAKEIVSYWQPIKTWSQVSLVLSQNGDELALAPLLSLCGIYIWFAIDRRREKKRNRVAYNKISKNDKQVIDAIRQTERNTHPTLNNIALTYTEAAESPLDRTKLLEKLAELERIGIIKQSIANKDDEPLQTWKTDCFTRKEPRMGK